MENNMVCLNTTELGQAFINSCFTVGIDPLTAAQVFYLMERQLKFTCPLETLKPPVFVINEEGNLNV